MQSVKVVRKMRSNVKYKGNWTELQHEVSQFLSRLGTVFLLGYYRGFYEDFTDTFRIHIFSKWCEYDLVQFTTSAVCWRQNDGGTEEDISWCTLYATTGPHCIDANVDHINVEEINKFEISYSFISGPFSVSFSFLDLLSVSYWY